MLRLRDWMIAGVPLLLVALLIVMANTIVAYRTWATFNRSSLEASRTDLVQDKVNELLSSLKDAETGERGFFLTGQDEYLESYRRAVKEIPILSNGLASLADSADESQRIERLKLLAAEKLEELKRSVELRRSEGADAAMVVMLSGHGKAVMDQIRVLVTEITADSGRRLTQASEAARTDSRLLELLTTIGSGVLFLILILSTLHIQRGAQHREELIQDLQRNEEALRHQHERLERIVATAPGAICAFRVQPDGLTSLPYASAGFRKMLPELPDLEHDAAPLFAALHPDDVTRVRTSVAESARTMTPWCDKYRIVTPSRGAVWVDGNFVPTREPDGSVNWYGFLTDVTERVRLDQLLIEAKQEYRALIDNSPDVIERFDLECRHLFVNKRVLEVTGLAEEAFIGKRTDELGFPSDFSEEWMREIRRVIATGQSKMAEYTFPSVNGKTLWEIRMVPELGKDGSVQSVLTIGLEITERRRAEETAREQESISTLLFDTASQAILGVGANGAIELMNVMAEEMFGYQRNELLGKQLETLLPEPLRQKHVALRESFSTIPKKRPMGLGTELQARRKDGSTFPIEVSLSYLQTSRGFLAVTFVTDITVRKQNEQALRKSVEDLQKLSIALITAEEDAARQIARELHDDITQRLAFLSMEIGKAAAQPPKAEELVGHMRSYQAKILQISEGIRMISRQMHPSILDDLGLSAALESICLELQDAEGTHVHFETRNVPEEIDRTVASCLYRIGQESLRNISKHAKAQDVNVALSREGELLQMTITDSGIGFDSATQKRGLGMHSLKERVRLVNGSLTVDSAPGKGTKVVVQIPLKGEPREPNAYSVAN